LRRLPHAMTLSTTSGGKVRTGAGRCGSSRAGRDAVRAQPPAGSPKEVPLPPFSPAAVRAAWESLHVAPIGSGCTFAPGHAAIALGEWRLSCGEPCPSREDDALRSPQPLGGRTTCLTPGTGRSGRPRRRAAYVTARSAPVKNAPNATDGRTMMRMSRALERSVSCVAVGTLGGDGVEGGG